MTPINPSRSRHILLYEPRTEGHHVSWLKFITEDLLSAGAQLTLAVDRRPEQEAKIREHLGDLLKQVALLDVNGAERSLRHGHAGSVAHCLRQSRAESVFLCAFDEVASDCWRRAALGLNMPEELRGRMGGIYHRARFLTAPKWSPRHWLKRTGFRRIMDRRWLRQLIFLDEYLTRDLQGSLPGAPIFFLPVPCVEGFAAETGAARRQLGLPADKRIFLFYGGGYRRKGLHLAVRAMLNLPPEVPALLLCVGQLNPEGATARDLDILAGQNRAHLINRYVSTEEEKLSFAASDVVLLPYVHHFGASGVLSQAVAARRMVIVSDEELLGRLTRDHGLGLLFPTENADALRDRIQEAALMTDEQMATYSQAAEKYAAMCSRKAYRLALTNAVLNLPESLPTHA